MVAVQHKVEKHGRVRTTHRRGNRVVAAPLYSTPRNRDPTVNKRNLKKIRDDLYREQARVEDEKKREATRKMRNEHQSRMTHYEIEQGWKEVEHKYGFALPPEFQSPALDGVERQAYTDRCKALDFYVMRIEQVNTFVDRRYVPRPVSAAAPARRPPPPPVVMEDDDPDWKDDIDERKGNARGYKGRKKGEDDDDERDPHDGAPGGPRFDEEIQIRKRQRHEPDEGRDPDDADPAESHGRPFQGRLPNASAWRKKTDVPHRDDEPSPYQQWDVGDAVASSKPWFDLKQDDASVEATLRLSGFMEQPGLGPGAPVETVPGVVYVHNFRSRMYALVPPVLWPLLGLVPRSELERDVHVQYVDARDETTATDADYQRTGLVQLSQRRSIRDWLTQLQPLLEEATREAMAWNKRKTNRNAPYILALRLVWRAPQYQFQENCLYPFVEITTCLPQVVPQLREILQAGLAIPWPKDAQTRVLAGTFPVAIAALIDQYAPRGPAEEPPTLSFSVYECDIRYAEQRFPADTELAGDTWITLPRDTFSIRPARERRTLGLVADRRNPRCEVPAVAEFDTSFRTMQVHSQRAKLERKPNRMPFNYKRLLERTRGITWSPRSPLHPDQPPTGPPLRPAYPALGPNLEVLDPHHPLAPLPHQPFVPPAKWDPAAPPTSIVSTGPPLPTWDELMRLMAPPPAPPPKPPEEKKAPEGPNWKRIANYPLLVWDIECAPKYNPRLPPERQIKRFPNPLLDDPVVAVSLLLGRTGQATVPQNANECQAIVVATAKSAAFENMPGCRIVYVPTERELLLYVAWVMRKVMPGYILSYNGDRFDWPYILDRSIRLCEPLIQYPTAIPEPLIIKESSRGTKGSGDFIQSDVFAKGTNNVDLLRVMRRLQTERFTSYSLNNMAQHFLKQTKADVHHTDIPRLIRGTPLQVRRLLIYNIWDALLVLRLFFKQKYHLNIPFMARSTGIQAQQLFEMGPGTSSLASFLIECAPDGLLRPLRRRRNVSTKFKGATVIRPKTGFYLRPIPVMDFASLYPSIMIAFNLCMSTNLTHEEIVRMRIPKDQYITVYSGPNGEPTYWTKPSLRQGILPIQLQSFLAARAAAKKAMGDATSLSEKDVYDCIQAVMKIRANSVYGLTKEMMEKISATVTYIGRQFILYMKRVVEEHMVPANGFGPAQGFPTQPQVAYGDTDSIMCDFGDVTVPRAFEIGKIIAALAKFAFKEYGHIVKLEFEKVYYPFMLPKKKR
jgi:DNA polymerase elongation subunit (family B)